jgi:hypothetical protein
MKSASNLGLCYVSSDQEAEGQETQIIKVACENQDWDARSSSLASEF